MRPITNSKPLATDMAVLRYRQDALPIIQTLLFSRTFQDLQRPNSGVFQDSKKCVSRPVSSANKVWGRAPGNLKFAAT